MDGEDLSAEDLADLLALGKQLAGEQKNPFEPSCVARAFATQLEGALRFTMQTWIDLEALRSPLLLGRVPSEIAELEQAANLFRLSVNGLEGEEALRIAERLRSTVQEGFEMALPMRQEGARDSDGGDGFGSWGRSSPSFSLNAILLTRQPWLYRWRKRSCCWPHAAAIKAGGLRAQPTATGTPFPKTPRALRALNRPSFLCPKKSKSASIPSMMAQGHSEP